MVFSFEQQTMLRAPTQRAVNLLKLHGLSHRCRAEGLQVG
jgi:hypothetical protein